MNKPTALQQRGLTLVEILVAVAISSLLIAGVIQIFASNKAAYRLQEGLARMQENARFALDFMTWDIRQAGYLGCTRNLDIQIGLSDAPDSFTPGAGIQGWEFIGTGAGDHYVLNPTDIDQTLITTTGNDEGWQGWTPDSGATALDTIPEVIAGSDILRVWHGTPVTRQVETFGSTTPSTLALNDTSELSEGDFILLSDCMAAEVLQICHVGNDGTLDLQSGESCEVGNDSTRQLSTLASNAEITPLTSTLYFVGKLGEDPQNPPSLFIGELSDAGTITSLTTQELIQGVDSMQILYGEETSSGLIYRSADQVEDWGNITTISIGLLMRTVDEVETQSRSGTFNVNNTELEITPSDRRSRKIFTTTIHLRNRTT